MIRQTISHYKITGKLGEGGMGEVYKAEDTRLGRSVALKLLPAQMSQDPLALERFKREAQTASSLDHPNICMVYDVGEHEGQPFLVMQYLEGLTLKELLKKAPFKLNRILEIGSQIARGLMKAHDSKIIHRDIKPANIIITPDGLAKILDFGLAKLSSDQSTRIREKTSPGKTMGTTLYMSPEQVRGEEVDNRSDLFSLGVILYEMATGKLPYSGTTSGTVFEEILNNAPVEPSRLNPEIPPALERMILKCLEKDPDLRYQSARDLLTDMKRILRGPVGLATVQGSLLASTVSWMNWKMAPAAVAGILGLLLVLWGSGIFETFPPDSSVGVIPFKNVSGDVEQEALADGLTEDIVAQLTKISGLKVYRFKGVEKDPEEKASELGVGTLLEGRIRRLGDNIRISAQLTEARTRRVLWSENYSRRLEDVFSLQREIALEVASALEVELLPGEAAVETSSPTDNVEAYNLYLQGRFLRHTQENPEGLRQAIAYFRQAIELDQDYALAWAGLAECYFMLASIYGEEPWEKFGEAAAIAVHFGESLPEPHVAMGLWSDFWEDDPAYADAEFRRALEIDPRHSNARREYARFLMRRGRFDEALAEIEKVRDPMFAVTYHLTRSEIFRYRGQYDAALMEAHEFYRIWSGSDEPLVQMVLCYIPLVEYQKAIDLALRISAEHPLRYRLLALIYLLQNRMEEVREASSQLIERQPDVPFTWWLNGNMEFWEQNYVEARKHFDKAKQLKAREDLTWWRPYSTYLGITYWKTGDQKRAEELFAESIRNNEKAMEQGNQHPELRRDMAVIYAIRGETDTALQWLEQAIEKGASLYDLTLKDGLLADLYENPRFQQMTEEAGLKIRAMRMRIEEMEIGWN